MIPTKTEERHKQKNHKGSEKLNNLPKVTQTVKDCEYESVQTQSKSQPLITFFCPKVGLRFLTCGFPCCLEWDSFPWVGGVREPRGGACPHLQIWVEVTERWGVLRVIASRALSGCLGGGRTEQTIPIVQKGMLRPEWSLALVTAEPAGESTTLGIVCLE